MPHISAIKPEVLSSAQELARSYLKTYTYKGKSFFEHLGDRDDSTLPIPTHEMFVSYQSIEKFLSTYYAVKSTIKQESHQSHIDLDSDLFSHLFALYAAGVEGFECTRNDKNNISQVDRVQTRKPLHIVNAQNIGHIFQNYFDLTISLKNQYGSGKKLLEFTHNFYDWILQSTQQWLTQDTLRPYYMMSKDFHLKVDGKIITGFSWEIYREEVSSATFSFDQLVGVKDAGEKLSLYAKQLFLYDPSTKINIELESIPRTILLYSRPGTGKSSLVQIMIQLMREYERVTKKMFTPVFIDNSIKNMYHGESVKNLDKLLRSASNPEGIGLVCIDDIDMVLQSRSDPSANHAEIQIVAEIMNYISGVRTNQYLGNHINIFMTNAPHKLDNALLNDRIEEYIFVKGPTNEAEYLRVISDLLHFQIENGFIPTVAEFAGLAQRCTEQQFSGRQVRNLCKSIQQRIIVEEPSAQICLLTPSDQKRSRSSAYKSLSIEQIMHITEQFISNQHDALAFRLERVS